MKAKDKVIYTMYGPTGVADEGIFTLTDERHDVWLGPISGYFYTCPSSGLRCEVYLDIDDVVREVFGGGA